MKTTRFNAAVSGLFEKAKGIVRYNQVKSCLQHNTYDVEEQLLIMEEEKTKLIKVIATGPSSQLKENLQQLANIILKEESLKEQQALGEKVLALLNEEIEVEEDKK